MKESKKQWIKEKAFWQDDPLIGAKVVQLTGNLSMATNIYSEDPTCSKDNIIAVFRSTKIGATGELCVVDIKNEISTEIDSNVHWVGACAQAYGDFFFYPCFNKGKWEMRRLCFSTLQVEVIHNLSGETPYTTLGSVSPDGRYIANQKCPDENFYQVIVLDTETGEEKIIAEGPDFCNPHPRFDRIKGEWVLVQKNCGCRFIDREIKRVDTDVAVTLVLCNRDGLKQVELPVAKPSIPCEVSGHEAWIKNQTAFIFSSSPVNLPYDDGQKCGNLLLYCIGDEKPRVIAHAPELYFGHVSTSACGNYWCCDAWEWKHDRLDCCVYAPKIAVGSIKTGKFAFVCQVEGFWPEYEIGHSHPYMSADNKHIVFVSTRTGFPQIFCAEIPDGFLKNLDI